MDSKMYNLSVKKIFGKRVAMLRKEHKDKMWSLAESISNRGIKLDKATISRWEAGLVEPRIAHVRAIAIFYNVSSDWLLGLSNNRD